MKKVLSKLKRKKTGDQPSLRITNETVAEHRERVLAGGRRFKYPVQYARHKLVFNAIALSLVVLVGFGVVSWWQLYKAQNSSTFFYRVTKVIPLPVASADGAVVRFSDYLMRYRSQEHWLAEKGQIEQGTKDSQRQLDFIKRAVMDSAVADAYAAKIAHEKKISISDSEVDQVIERSLRTANGTISQELYDASTLETLGYDRDEYRLLIHDSLLRQKVAYALDTTAEKMVDSAKKLLAAATAPQDFSAIAQTVSNGAKAGSSGIVKKTNQDAGLTQAALKLTQGEITKDAVKSTTGDGYYFIRLDELRDSELSYSFIKIPLTAFEKKLQSIRKDNKVREYIAIPKAQTQSQ